MDVLYWLRVGQSSRPRLLIACTACHRALSPQRNNWVWGASIDICSHVEERERKAKKETRVLTLIIADGKKNKYKISAGWSLIRILRIQVIWMEMKPRIMFGYRLGAKCVFWRNGICESDLRDGGRQWGFLMSGCLIWELETGTPCLRVDLLCLVIE